MESVYYGGNDYRDYLAHHGIKGMHWGIRRYQPYPDGFSGEAKYIGDKRITRKTRRLAKKDAKEFARARMFYGEGAGNRRKLIKARVEEYSKKIPGYKEEFEKYSSKQDMAKHAGAARRERKIRDVKNSTVKTSRGIFNLAVGNAVPVAASSVTAYKIMKMTGMDLKAKNTAVKLGRKAVDKMRKFIH